LASHILPIADAVFAPVTTVYNDPNAPSPTG
jgi:hypothetical protein